MNVNAAPSRIVIAGGGGFIGKHLTEHLIDAGWSVAILSRGRAPAHHPVEAEWVQWDGRTLGDWAGHLEGAAGLINLAGRNVNCRYTASNRRAILQSRLDSVHVLDEAVGRCQIPPAVWVQASTLAIHGDRGDAWLDEASPPGHESDFSPGIGRAWEAAFGGARAGGARKVLLRMSFVLGTDGGALPFLARLARFGLGGRIGSGRQFYSWVHVEDVSRVVEWALSRTRLSGLFNVTSPNPVRNAAFMAELRRVVRRPPSPPVPVWAIRLGCLLMRTEPELALRSRRGLPRRLEQAGFRFKYPELGPALDALLAPKTAERAAAVADAAQLPRRAPVRGLTHLWKL